MYTQHTHIQYNSKQQKITEKNEINVVHKTPICHKIHWLFVVLYYDLGFRFL